MRVSKVTAAFSSPIGTATVEFFASDQIGITRASVIAHDMAGRIYDGRRCELVSISVSYNHEVMNSDYVMHSPMGR